MAPKKNPNPPGTRQLTLAEVSPVVAALEVPKHLRAEFLKGFGVEWEHAHTVGYDLMLVGGIVLDHLAEDPHYYRKLQRARLNPSQRPARALSDRVQACFDALLSSVQEQYPSLSCTLRVDSKAGQRDGQACARAYAFCEDLDDGSFRIAVAAKMNDADDSRVEGLLRHELAHAVLLHGGDMEHTERDADEVAEELFGSPLFYDDEDVQTTDQSAPGARHPRPEYLDGPDGRTLDSAEPMGEDGPDAPRGTMQLNTVEDVVSALDDAAAQGDAKTPRLIASQLSQQAKQVGGAQSRTLLTLAKAARHCATGVEARLDGQIDRAMTSERMCDAALQEAAMPRSRMGRENPEWAKKLGSGLYKGARYSAETAHDLYQGARAAHAARSEAEAAAREPERKNPRATMGEVQHVMADLQVPKAWRTRFMQGLNVEWSEHGGGIDAHSVGALVIEHLNEDEDYYRKSRRNPSPLPEGFFTSFGIDVPDDYVAPPLPESQRVLRDLQRDDIVTVGRTQWVIMRSIGDSQAYAYKYPSKRTKLYVIEGTGPNTPDTVIVYEVGGSGQRISEDVARGPLRLTY